MLSGFFYFVCSKISRSVCHNSVACDSIVFIIFLSTARSKMFVRRQYIYMYVYIYIYVRGKIVVKKIELVTRKKEKEKACYVVISLY